MQIQTDDFVAIGDHVDAVALDHGGRRHAAFGPVEIDVAVQLGHDQLPLERSVGFVQAQQDAAVAVVLRVAWAVIVRSDQHAAVADDRGRVAFRAQRDGPVDVLARLWIEPRRQSCLRGDHVSR